MGQILLTPENAIFDAGPFPQRVKVNGTNFPVTYLSFDQTTSEDCFWAFQVPSFASGLQFTTIWNTDTVATGVFGIGIQIAAMTPDTDTGSMEAKAFDTETPDSDTHLTTTARRPHIFTTTIAAADTDDLTDGDWCVVRYRRDVSVGSNLAADVRVESVLAEWTD
jgi:hypothetical protein